MTDTTKTEALRLAEHLENFRSFPDDLAAAAELRRLSAVEAERYHYKARCEALTDDALARVMEASEDELDAALKLEGKDPDDTARLAGQAVELALLTAERDRLAAECEALRADAERYRWLRSNWFTMGSSYGHGRIQFETNIPRWSDKFSDSDIDTAIDAAMGGKE